MKKHRSFAELTVIPVTLFDLIFGWKIFSLVWPLASIDKQQNGRDLSSLSQLGSTYNGLFRILVQSKIRGNLLFFTRERFSWKNAAAIFHHEEIIRKNFKKSKKTIDNCYNVSILKP